MTAFHRLQQIRELKVQFDGSRIETAAEHLFPLCMFANHTVTVE